MRKSSNKRPAPSSKTQIVSTTSTRAGSNSMDWWNHSNPHTEVFNVANRLAANHRTRHVANMRNAWFYQHQALLSFFPGTNYALNGWYPIAPEQLTYNVINSVCNTVNAKINRDKIKITFLTNDGDAAEQRQAKILTKFMLGQWLSNNYYAEADKVMLDACVFGTGIMYHYFDESQGKIVSERCLVDEILVDEFEAQYDTPRQLLRRKLVDKELLKSLYPDSALDIERASCNKYGKSDRTISNMALVVEAWHLPDENGKGGKHTICVDTGCLFEEDYQKNYFPFTKFQWQEPLDGFYGIGIAFQLTGIQLKISELLNDVALGIRNFAVPRIMREINSQVDVNHLTNNIDGAIIDYLGTPPSFWTPSQVMPGDVYRMIDDLYKRAYEVIGVSQLTATSQKPKGLESGIALENYHAIEDQRFVKQVQRWENFHLQVCNIYLDLAQEHQKELKEVTVPGRRASEIVDLKDIDLQKDKYTIQAFPTDLLPNTPAGRLQIVQELIKAGYITKEYGISLLRFPDIDAYTDLQTANVDACFNIVCSILEDGEVPEILPWLDQNLLLKISQLTSIRATYCQKGVDPDNLQLLTQFIETISDQLVDLTKVAAPPAQPDMGLPNAAPGSMPNQLALPNTPQGTGYKPPYTQMLPYQQ